MEQIIFYDIVIFINNEIYMKFFLDTADTDKIRDLYSTGLVDGVTTNPSLIAKSGKDFFETLSEISSFVEGPISAEVTSTS